MGNFCKKEEEGAARRGKEKEVAARRGRRKRGRRHQQMGLGPSSSLSFFITSGHYTLPPIREFVLEFCHFYDRNQHNGKTDLTS